MTTATTDQSPPIASAPGGGRQQDFPAEHWVDLCRLDYYEGRRRPFMALRAMLPNERLRLTSDGADDVCRLRYEVEARMSRRQPYRWSLPGGAFGAVETTVRPRPRPGSMQTEKGLSR